MIKITIILVQLTTIGGCSRLQMVRLDNPPGIFSRLFDVDSTILQDMRYAGYHNLTGYPIPGYESAECILTRPAAEALRRIQNELRLSGLSLKVYDCFRPARASEHFFEWASMESDTLMKREFYPRESKGSLFEQGYIAERSGHSRGSTVDLTIVPLPLTDEPDYNAGDELSPCTAPVSLRFTDNSIDMGTGYDCMDKLSETVNRKIPSNSRINRLLLKMVMEKYGFRNYPGEWWHYTLIDEPFDNTYFDFVIR